MNTARFVFVIISCSALTAAAAGSAEPPAHNHPLVPTVVAKPIPRPAPARTNIIPHRGATPAIIGGPTIANTKTTAALNGTTFQKRGGAK